MGGPQVMVGDLILIVRIEPGLLRVQISQNRPDLCPDRPKFTAETQR